MKDKMDAKDKATFKLITGEDSPIENTSFSGIVGQEAVVRQLRFYLNSHRPNVVFPSLLFTGSHGLGKTYVAKILAHNMKRRFLEINCATLGSTKDFIEYVLLEKVMGMKPVTVLFDEAHKLSSEVTTLLLSLLASNGKGINTLEYRGWEICYDLTKINTVFATTDSFKIFPPLVNRCKSIYFKSYSNPELITMLKFYLPDIELSGFSSEDFEDLAYACRGRGRDTYELAENIKRSCMESKKFTLAQWHDLKDIFSINPMGLNAQELTLMRIIRAAGVISCSNIAARMMIGEENVSEEIEIRPKELWLIDNTSRGRTLTSRGEEYFSNFLHETVQQSQDKLGGKV